MRKVNKTKVIVKFIIPTTRFSKFEKMCDDAYLTPSEAIVGYINHAVKKKNLAVFKCGDEKRKRRLKKK